MKPLAVLISTFVLVVILMKITTKTINWTQAGRASISVMLLFTSMGHFLFIDGMAEMIPDFICCKREVILITGVIEVLLAILFFFHGKAITGWIIIGFFLSVLPANIYAAIEHINYQTGIDDGPGPEYLWFRIPLQIFLILWVYFSSIRN